MWGVRSEWETHLNDQHPIPNVQGGDTQHYAFPCKICLHTLFSSYDYDLSEESNKPLFIFRNSHYADHMERIALSALRDYSPGSSTPSRMQMPKKHSKRHRRLKYRPGLASDHSSSSSGRDEQAISGWSSEGSTGSEG